MISVVRSWRQSYPFLVLATLVVVAAADFFLYGATRIGWTAAIVATAMLAVLAARDTRFLGTLGGRIVWLATIGLLAALVEQPTWLNVFYLFVCLSALTLTNAQGWESNFIPWAQRWARWAATGWARVFLDNGVAMRWLVRRGLSPRTARGVAAWTVPVLLSSVFVALFALANPIISGWFSTLGRLAADLLVRLPQLLDIARILFWLAFAAIAWSLLRGRTFKPRAAAKRPAAARILTTPPPVSPPQQPSSPLSPASHASPPPPTPPPPTYSPPPSVVPGKLVARDGQRVTEGVPAALVVRCLVLFNLVFAVELALDLFVLLSSQYGSDGTAFKTYVRRGAYPLVAAALLAGLFVLLAFRPDSETERSPWARKLVYLWIGQTILLTLSAVWRLHRYVELTELTRLRVASIIWFLLVGLGLCYIIWRIVRRRSNAWLINVNALTALLVLYPCCFINFDGMIADFNARHCAEAGGGGSPLDIEYFRTLGTPALPALDSVRHQIPLQWRKEAAAAVSQALHAQLAADLADWRAWTWRKHRSSVGATEQFARTTRAPHTPRATYAPGATGAGHLAGDRRNVAQAAAGAPVSR